MLYALIACGVTTWNSPECIDMHDFTTKTACESAMEKNGRDQQFYGMTFTCDEKKEDGKP